ncbi:Putative acyl-CoA-binding protein [Tenacibaculum maritimum]|uniref:acyl-CoA-binding protein n=1 Tax=Tenacibaculum maritimum TaxID=107401 RepID=UPI0012E683C3|nr:acyl-CoA-binding protein [Tenacibaculum maritimum]CAA0166086.1 Putative acyl-CoA-binding protein [Tenacibaculum maritimum]CAA0166283.1 Putative acyl-CoA-binding protein [Tenacibaculum maritimum]CAA0243037.1 Putative acyl-CoA-binding protein [Tenacibaculum maritimum]
MHDDLNKQFQEAYQKASNTKQKLPQDIMLKLYAYYKQAVQGDHFPFTPDFNIRNAFKFNAWAQLKGIPSDEAKQEYINLVNSIIK